jgi:hypothetical protein
MNKERSSKHSKKRSKKSSKKSKKHKRSSYEDYSSDARSSSNKKVHAIKPIVEYSDVSSEDFSEPEAGEITDESGSTSVYGNKANIVTSKMGSKPPLIIAEKRDSVGSSSGAQKLHQSLINASPISSTHSPNQVLLSSDSRPLPLDEIASPSPLPPELEEEEGQFGAVMVNSMDCITFLFLSQTWKAKRTMTRRRRKRSTKNRPPNQGDRRRVKKTRNTRSKRNRRNVKRNATNRCPALNRFRKMRIRC